MTWTFIWMAVILKIPIVALLWLVWWAVQEEPRPAAEDTADGGGGGGHSPKPRKPRPPRRGDHAEVAIPASGRNSQPPARIRARSRETTLR